MPSLRSTSLSIILLCGGVAWLTGCAHRMLPAAAPPSPLQHTVTLFAEPFDRLDRRRWKEVERKGRTRYAIEEADGSRSLKADSRGGHASILLTPVRVTPEANVWLSWRWRVEQPVAAEDLTSNKGNDAAARVYVYYDIRGLPWQKRSVDYVWSSTLPAETALSSPFSKESQLIVANNGGALGVWQTVRRNLREDYLRCFGEEPPDVVAIGLMTDTDSAGGDATAYYDDVTLTRDPPADEAAPPAPTAVSAPP